MPVRSVLSLVLLESRGVGCQGQWCVGHSHPRHLLQLRKLAKPYNDSKLANAATIGYIASAQKSLTCPFKAASADVLCLESRFKPAWAQQWSLMQSAPHSAAEPACQTQKVDPSLVKDSLALRECHQYQNAHAMLDYYWSRQINALKPTIYHGMD